MNQLFGPLKGLKDPLSQMKGGQAALNTRKHPAMNGRQKATQTRDTVRLKPAETSTEYNSSEQQLSHKRLANQTLQLRPTGFKVIVLWDNNSIAQGPMLGLQTSSWCLNVAVCVATAWMEALPDNGGASRGERSEKGRKWHDACSVFYRASSACYGVAISTTSGSAMSMVAITMVRWPMATLVHPTMAVSRVP